MATQSDDLNLQDSMPRRHIKHAATQMAENIQAIQFITNLWWFSVCLHSYTGWIVMRYNFGERFMPTALVVYSSVMCVMMSYLAGSRIGVVFGLGLFLIGYSHRIQIMRRNNRKEIWHSYYDGTSYLDHLADRVPEKYQKYKKYIPAAESGLFVLVGILMVIVARAERPEYVSASQFYWPQAFGTYVASIGIAMLLHANKLKKDARNLDLDRRDGQIDNMMMAQMQEQDMQAVETKSLHTQSAIAQAV